MPGNVTLPAQHVRQALRRHGVVDLLPHMIGRDPMPTHFPPHHAVILNSCLSASAAQRYAQPADNVQAGRLIAPVGTAGVLIQFRARAFIIHHR